MQDEFDRALGRPVIVQSSTHELGRATLALVEEGLTTLEMYERLAVQFPSVQLTLDAVERLARQVADRRPVAKRYLQSKSLDMARNVVELGKPSDHVRALEGLGEVLDAGNAAAGGITIIVGGDAHIALLHGPRQSDRE